MIFFGLLLIVIGLSFPIWAGIKDKPFFRKILAASMPIIFVGIVLTFGDRLEELTVENVGSIKTAVLKANIEADEISKIRKRIETQADKIDLVAKEAKSALNNIKDVENILDSMKKYGEFSRIDFNGRISQGGGIGTISALGGLDGVSDGWDGGFVRLNKNRKTNTYQIKGDGTCSPTALKQYKSIIKKYPLWPFSHYILAVCLKQKGDKSWKEHAMRALEILEKTTAVPNHHPDHSIVMKEVNKILQE